MTRGNTEWRSKYKDPEKILEYKRQYYQDNKEKMDAQRRARYVRDREKELAGHKAYQKTEKGLQVTRERSKRAYRTQRDRADARTAVRSALSRGQLQKLPCRDCGNLRVHFHHTNGYDKENWLVGIWLCPSHHSQLHKKLRDELRTTK